MILPPFFVDEQLPTHGKCESQRDFNRQNAIKEESVNITKRNLNIPPLERNPQDAFFF